MIMVTMPSTAVARKLPGTAPTEERIDHQWGAEGEASSAVNWSRHTQYVADMTVKAMVRTAVPGQRESQRMVRSANEEGRSQRVFAVTPMREAILTRVDGAL